MNVRWQDNYHPHNLSLSQRLTAIAAILVVIHFAVGTALWLTCIASQTINLARHSRSGQFWTELAGWLPFYWRSCKSVTPFGLAVLVLYLIPHRLRWAVALLCGIVMLSALCAWYDISSELYDVTTFGPERRWNYFFTWWWCHQRVS